MSVSLSPQNFGDGRWYYENRGSIDVFIDTRKLSQKGGQSNFVSGDIVCVRIPKRKLLKSLQRMEPHHGNK